MALSESCLYGPELAALVDADARLVLNLERGFGEAWAVDADGGELIRLQGAAQQQVGTRLLPELARLRADSKPIVAHDAATISDGSAFQQLTALGYLDGGDGLE